MCVGHNWNGNTLNKTLFRQTFFWISIKSISKYIKRSEQEEEKKERNIKRDGDGKGHQNREFILNATRINVSIKSRGDKDRPKKKMWANSNGKGLQSLKENWEYTRICQQQTTLENKLKIFNPAAQIIALNIKQITAIYIYGVCIRTVHMRGYKLWASVCGCCAVYVYACKNKCVPCGPTSLKFTGCAEINKSVLVSVAI